MEANKQSYRAAKRAFIAERRAKVSDLYLNHGWTVYRIARELGCSVATVSEDMQALIAEWKQRTRLDIEAHRATELAKINAVEARALEAFERSRLPKRVASAAKRSDEQGEATVSSATQVERDEGDPRFLAISLRCIDQRCRLLGLFTAQQVEPEMKQPTTLSEWIAFELKRHEENRNGNVVPGGRRPPLPLPVPQGNLP